MNDLSAETRQKITQIWPRLLAWYRQHKRNLPWRDETDPYRIWVSEVMLQQTQVATVIPYYHRFLAQFPTVEALAAAPQEAVLKGWEGLGYYARARNLHKAARKIVADYQGRLPTRYEELRTLPGFGPYTAGAVASIAFGQAVPAIDGNARRVVARLFALKQNLTRGEGRQQLQKIGAALVYPEAPGDWTQAVMELGATLCLPQSPKCLDCPLRELCAGRLQGLEQTLPLKPATKALPHYNVTAAVIRRDGKLLIAQRPPDGMLGGLWEFPGGKQEHGETLEACLRREIKEELGVEIGVARPITVIKHSYTHFKITLHAFECYLMSGTPAPLGVADWRWVTLDQLESFPFPRTDQKIIQSLRRETD